MSSFAYVDNKKKDILILSEGPTQELDDTTLTEEKNYSINFTEHNKKFYKYSRYGIGLDTRGIFQ